MKNKDKYLQDATIRDLYIGFAICGYLSNADRDISSSSEDIKRLYRHMTAIIDGVFELDEEKNNG